MNDDQTSGYLLISLLRILSNMHCKELHASPIRTYQN
jgi:hypothetical protein